MLSIDSITLSFSETVLDGLSLTVPAGQMVGIVGPGGAGKSSLLKIIAGLLDPVSGSVYWNDKRVKGPSDQLIPGHPDIQLVNQDFGLDPYYTVQENVIQKMLFLPNELRSHFAEELLDLVGLTPLKDNKAIHLSGGEQQRLAIARALAVEPDVLLLDEPFAHLDVHMKERIGNYLRQLSEVRGMTCILVSHEGQDVIQWCSTVHFMSNGAIQRTATPQEFYFAPSSRYEALFFGEINELTDEAGNTVLFRPNECESTQDEGAIPVRFEYSDFLGAYWRTIVCTTSGERLVLHAQESLTDVRGIRITKKSPQA